MKRTRRRRNKRRAQQGTITRHRGFWCLRYRERIRVGDEVKIVQRSKRLAPVDEEHKTRKSVEDLVEAVVEPINKAPANYVAIQLNNFVEGTYLPFVESKRKPSTVRGYRQMWTHYLKPREKCAKLLMNSTETHMIQAQLDQIEREHKLSPQSMAHIKHFLSGIFRFAIKQGHVPAGTLNPVTSAETSEVSEFEGRAYSLEEIALMFAVLPVPSKTVMLTAAFTGLRVGELRGLTWEAYTPGDEHSLGQISVLRSVWRGRVGTPKTSRSKAVVYLVPQLSVLLEEHRKRNGSPKSGPIFANRADKPIDLDSLYRQQMKLPLEKAGIEWEGWHGFRRGLATNLVRLGIQESIAALVLRHTNERVTRKHYVKLLPLETVSAMRLLSQAFSRRENATNAPHKCSPDRRERAI